MDSVQRELPRTDPPRPTERHGTQCHVAEEWDGTATAYMHEDIATYRRNPTVHAPGLDLADTTEFGFRTWSIGDTHDGVMWKTGMADPKTPTTKDRPNDGASARLG